MPNFHLPAATHIGYAHLKVADLQRSLAFYRDLMGFKEIAREGGTVTLSADGTTPHLILTELPGAQPQPRRSTGLYHVAILLPTRAALSRLFRRMLEQRWQFQGASDHLVSEALYLDDPDGNGLELYHDRPRSQWPVANDGQVTMRSDPLNLENLLLDSEKDTSDWTGIDPQTIIGHVHLQVADIGKSEAFYVDTLGFNVTQRTYPGALFISAGGYHHHIGMNIWNSRNTQTAPPETAGLYAYSVVLPDADSWKQTIAHLESAGITIEDRSENGTQRAAIRDMDSNRVVLTHQ